MSNAFEVTDVAKRYGAITALDGVTLAGAEGQVFGLLGPNGSGKTTMVRVLSTLTVPDRGVATVGGIDVAKYPNKVRRLIGLAGQYAAVDEFQTGYENIYMVGQLYGLGRKEAKRRTTDILERLDLVEAAHRAVRTYSGGMRRRLDLGASLVGRPRILFLDEPTTGLDPKTRNDSWSIVRDLVADGTSILLTTQYLDEADELATVIAILDHGKLIAQGTSDELKAHVGGDVVEIRTATAAERAAALAAVAPFATKPPTYDEATSTLRVPVRAGFSDLALIVQALNDAKVQVVALSLHRPSLDDVFLSLTQADVAAPPVAMTR